MDSQLYGDWSQLPKISCQGHFRLAAIGWLVASGAWSSASPPSAPHPHLEQHLNNVVYTVAGWFLPILRSTSCTNHRTMVSHRQGKSPKENTPLIISRKSGLAYNQMLSQLQTICWSRPAHGNFWNRCGVMQDHDSRGSPCPEAWQTRADQGQGKLGRGRPPEQRQNPKITRAAPLPLVVLSSTQYSIERNLYFWYFTFERLTKFQDCTVFVQKRRTFMIISNNRPVFAKAWRTWWFSVPAQLQRDDKLPVVVHHTLWIDHYAKAESRTGEGGLFAANLQHTCCPGLGPRSLCGCWRRKKGSTLLFFVAV